MKAVTEEHPDVPVLQPENMWYKEMQHAGGDLSQMLSLNDKGWYTEVYQKPMPKMAFTMRWSKRKRDLPGKRTSFARKTRGSRIRSSFSGIHSLPRFCLICQKRSVRSFIFGTTI